MPQDQPESRNNSSAPPARALKRRFIAALMGGPLLLVTLVEAYFQSFGLYEDHYLIPKEKYGVLTPLRWQDIIFLVVFWPVAIALFYFSYRLLKYAFRHQPGVTA